MKNYFDFTGKKYLITGASSGIGQTTAKCMAEQGASIVLLGRNEDRLKETYDSLAGSGHLVVVADLNKYDDMTDLFIQMVSDGRKLDGFVHSAGISKEYSVAALYRSAYEEMTNINLYVFMELIRLFSKKKFHNEKGSIVAVSSIAAVKPEKGQALYSAAKAGMNSIVYADAMELIKKGIRINSVMPGMVKTPIYYDFIKEVTQEKADEVTASQLLGVIEPEAVAETIMFLLSDCSRMITGRAMYVDAATL